MQSGTGSPGNLQSGALWGHNALLVPGYLLLAWAGAWLAFPPGYASPLAPAAGLALAAVLVHGVRVLPGIGIGALLFFLSLDFSPAGLFVAVLLAAAVLLQTALAFRLTRRFVAAPVGLTREREIGRFLLLAGPVSGLVSAGLGVAVLFMMGRLVPAELSSQWLAWWVGQSLGMALFTPLLLVYWPGEKPLWPGGRGRIALPLLLTAGLLAAGDLGLDRLERAQAREVQREAMQQSFDAGFPWLEAAVAAVRGVERFYAASEEVTREEFAVFAAHTLDWPGLIALEWLPRIDRAERDTYEAAARGELDREFEITEYGPDGARVRAGERATYFPGHYVEPMEGNEAVLGFDYFSDPVRRAAIEHAWFGGEAVAAEPVRLLQTGRPGLLLFVPVHRQGFAAATDAGRRAALQGVLLAVFDIEAVLGPLAQAAAARGLAFRVTDAGAAAGSRVLADTLPPDAAPDWRRRVAFAGRELRLEMQPVEPYWRRGAGLEARVFLAFSMLAGLLLAFTSLAAGGRNMAAESRVAERTAELRRELQRREAAEAALRESEEALAITLGSIGDGVLATDPRGRVTRMNPVAEALTGWPADEACGRPVDEVFRIIHEQTREPAVVPVDEVLHTGNVHGLANHTVLVARDGSERAVADSAAPIRDPAGAIHGVVLVFRDAERERAAAHALQASEERYRRFIELAPYGVFVQCGGRFVFLNPRMVEMLGAASAQELLGRDVLDFLHSDSRAAVRERIRRLNEERAAAPPLAERWLRVDGSTFDGEATAVPYEHEGRAGALVLLQDISQRKEADRRIQDLNRSLELRVRERGAVLEALHQKEEEVSAIVDNLFDCVISIDSQGIVRSVNPAVTAVFGYAEEEIVGRNVSMLMTEPDASRHDHYLARFVDTGEARIIGLGREVTGRHRDGRQIPLHLSVREYRVRGERLFVGILQDISERQQFISELTRARNDAEQANRAKSAFLATMSHEIRTPMNGVIGLVDVLEHSQLSTHQADLVETIRASANSLLRIIDDILDFSKIEAGRLEIEQAPVSIPDLVEGLGNSLVPVAARQGVDLAVFVDPRVPERVLADDVRLRQVLYNLLGNAIKFSSGRPGCRGHVAIRAEIECDRPLRVRFSVIDNGIGMSPETVRGLFQAFTQAEISTTRRFGGTGLGLAICRRLVDMMGGEIDVDSRPDEGSIFRVVLPFVLAPEQPAGQDPDLGGVHCAIVDGPGLETQDLRVYLEHAGASVTIVDHVSGLGRAAQEQSGPVVGIRRAEDRRVSPEEAGPANLRHLLITRGRRRRARVSGEDTVTLDGGALRRRALVRAVAVAAGLASPEIFQEPGQQRLPGEDRPPPSVSEARARNRLILVAEDDAVNQKVILQQLALLGHAAEVAPDGKAALERWREGGYALVLSDLHMPEMDGYSLARAIRSEEGSGRRTPILALTANALKGEASRATAAGMDEYLTKPLPLEQLRAALERWLPGDAGPPDSGRPAEAGKPADSTEAPIFDVSVLTALVGDDPVTLRGFLDEYLDSLRDGLAQVDVAAAAEDLVSVAASAHRLKSSSRSVGALQLADVCADLERGAREGDRVWADRALRVLIPAREALEKAIMDWKRGVDPRQGSDAQ